MPDTDKPQTKLEKIPGMNCSIVRQAVVAVRTKEFIKTEVFWSPRHDREVAQGKKLYAVEISMANGSQFYSDPTDKKRKTDELRDDVIKWIGNDLK